ncbi:hypothetical protein BSKO_09477 [Bryopsis sp. KO-2023]|nr:hypothetical protein BSKO_09477 [Bryopsis sp. KO-2023]
MVSRMVTSLVLMLPLLAGVAVAKEYYDYNYRGENPFYKYDGKHGADYYSYQNSGRWRQGRSTYFDTIDNGSCGYGHQYPGRGTGLDIAAISDKHYDYWQSCGRCYEIKCRPMEFYDNYGNHLDRNTACHDPNKIITVTITDVCPCFDPLPWNYANNKRWCCGDMEHFDLSWHAFLKLADQKWGVIGTYYRPVTCPYEAFEKRHHHEDHTRPGYTGRRKTLGNSNIEIIAERYESEVSP